MRKLRTISEGRVRVLVNTVREDLPEIEGMNWNSMNNARTAAMRFRAYRAAMNLPEAKEAFLVVVLDSKHKPIGFETVSIGTLSASLVHPREVFRSAIVLAGSAIVACHNHPSGDPTPSGDDDSVTERLREVGGLLGVPCLDHVILGDNKFYAYSDCAFHSYIPTPYED